MNASKIKDQAKLLIAFTGGDKQAFNQVFDYVYGRLHFFAVGFIHDEVVAEDLVQETIIKAWQKKEQFNSFPELKSFLYVGVRNACFNHLDKLKVQQKYHDSMQYEDLFDNQTVLHALIRSEVISNIFSAVDTLPDQCRKVMRMIFDEGKKPEKIADELGVTVSTVNNHKMRGIMLLKEKIRKSDLLIMMLLSFLN